MDTPVQIFYTDEARIVAFVVFLSFLLLLADMGFSVDKYNGYMGTRQFILRVLEMFLNKK